MAFSAEQYWPDKKLMESVSMPAVGLGTYQIKDADLVFQAVDGALAAGCRMFDTAPIYGNEISLGKAFKELLPKYNLTREDIFITSKLGPREMTSGDRVVKAYKRSLHHLETDYLDLYLISYPSSSSSQHNYDDRKHKLMRQEAWDALVRLYESAEVNSIGISNFKLNQIQDILENKNEVVPAVNQLEFNPYRKDQELLNFCQNLRITTQAFSSLGGMTGKADLLHHPDVIDVAKDVGASPAQVLLVWALEKDLGVIPKSTNQEHIIENNSLNFRLTSDQVKLLDGLKKFSWPRDVS